MGLQWSTNWNSDRPTRNRSLLQRMFAFCSNRARHRCTAQSQQERPQANQEPRVFTLDLPTLILGFLFPNFWLAHEVVESYTQYSASARSAEGIEYECAIILCK
ncbi:MAG: hypothetical protein A2864_00555 [Candidatus Woykebacteria bacterium RIFCSPHIGHO2_01_FULL_39_12]|uniref:Uncharacterized protein n=1 Tax=Candidatus Woykebacteria bacterium RIFCSPHIGHO2_01_FULL_39_12 TaxID=1802599 RepID=A0A1G1WIM6_9BACT|nr:MAG: hypothetical protein A2864_00555 [Candidatus Woykebacteria bacterium RIFCSPHIGHO2_01_FULL_39_12]